MTRSVLDKLTGIKADLVRGQENWQDWDLPHLAQALKKWRDINPATEGNNVESMITPSKRPENKSRFFHAESMDKRRSVYCDDALHISRDCTRVSKIVERKRILAQKRMCFNCTGKTETPYIDLQSRRPICDSHREPRACCLSCDESKREGSTVS